MSFLSNIFCCFSQRDQDLYPSSSDGKYRRILPEETEQDKNTIVASKCDRSLITIEKSKKAKSSQS